MQERGERSSTCLFAFKLNAGVRAFALWISQGNEAGCGANLLMNISCCFTKHLCMLITWRCTTAMLQRKHTLPRCQLQFRFRREGELSSLLLTISQILLFSHSVQPNSAEEKFLQHSMTKGKEIALHYIFCHTKSWLSLRYFMNSVSNYSGSGPKQMARIFF